jgi:hypothetical protein
MPLFVSYLIKHIQQAERQRTILCTIEKRDLKTGQAARYPTIENKVE